MGTAHSDPSQGKCLQLFNPLSPFFSSFFLSLPVSGTVILHYVLCVLRFFLSVPLCPLPIHLFSLCTEKASCSSRMCGTETIVKEPRWQETRLRKTEISIHFLTTSFYFLPADNILFSLTQLQ